MSDEQLQVIMGLIINAGDAKNDAKLALKAAKNKDFTEAEDRMKSANQDLVKAHNTQTNLLTNEASGATENVNLLTVHSQDHLMNAITYVELTQEMIEIYKRFSN